MNDTQKIANLKASIAMEQSVLDALIAEQPVTPPIDPPPIDPPPIVGAVEVDWIEAHDDSAQIFLKPFPGAVDYLAYIVRPGEIPHEGKAAGGAGRSASRQDVYAHDENGNPLIWGPTWGQLNDQSLPTRLEVNGLDPFAMNKVVILAYDGLIPYTYIDGRTVMPPCTEGNACKGIEDWDCPAAMRMNGHGQPGSRPNIIGRSAVIEVTCKPFAPSPGASQVFFEPFRDGTFKPPVSVPPDPRTLTMDTQTRRMENDRWTLETYHTLPFEEEFTPIFQKHNHLMTIIADKSRVGYCSNVLSPKAVADISGGKVLVWKVKVDNHGDGSRWVDLMIAPEGDCIINSNHAVDVRNPTFSKNCIVANCEFNGWRLRQFDARSANPGVPQPGGSAIVGERLVGQTVLSDPGGGQPFEIPPGALRRPPWSLSTSHPLGVGGPNGMDNDVDCGHVLEIHLSIDRVRILEEGVVKIDRALWMPLNYTRFRLFLLHHIYDLNKEGWELRNNFTSDEKLWKQTPMHDQRHIDDFSFEVLPMFPA